jgi:quinoprotein glucose dehydrogenase
LNREAYLVIACSVLGLLLLLPFLTFALADPAAAGNWPMPGRDPGGTRYSTLTQITPANVSQLKVAWVYHMKPAGTAVQPSPIGGPAAGDWFHHVRGHPLQPGGRARFGYRARTMDVSNSRWRSSLGRGAAYWPGGEGAGPAVIFGTRRGRMYSISAATGQLNQEFGDHGMVDLKTPEVMTTGKDKSYILPTPPTIYKNLVITGSGPGEGPGGLNGGVGPAGDTRAWDARTGKLVWTFHSVPRPGEVGHETWAGDSWKDRSGVNVWGYMTVDVARGILYMPFGAPNNDRVGVDRPGNNLFG